MNTYNIQPYNSALCTDKLTSTCRTKQRDIKIAAKYQPLQYNKHAFYVHTKKKNKNTYNKSETVNEKKKQYQAYNMLRIRLYVRIYRKYVYALLSLSMYLCCYRSQNPSQEYSLHRTLVCVYVFVHVIISMCVYKNQVNKE